MGSPAHTGRGSGGGTRTGIPARESRSGSRRRCPTCGARRREQPVCPRCGTDLSELIAVEAHADRLYRSARAAYRRGFFRTAAGRADAASRLEARPEILRLAAVAALRSGDFAAAVRAARRAAPALTNARRADAT